MLAEPGIAQDKKIILKTAFSDTKISSVCFLYVFTQLVHYSQDMTQGQFFKGIVLAFSFS